jgi:hypothetical protein
MLLFIFEGNTWRSTWMVTIAYRSRIGEPEPRIDLNAVDLEQEGLGSWGTC